MENHTEKRGKILNGNALAALVEAQVKKRVSAIRQTNRPPGLGVILVGENPASKAYVARKERVADSVGFVSTQISLPENASEKDLNGAIDQFNNARDIDGILLQLPLPKHLPSDPFIDRISPLKDADGLTAINQGRLMRGQKAIRPCTPAGALLLIDLALTELEIDDPGIKERAAADSASGDSPLSTLIPKASLAGKKAIVIGRSVLVGKPVSLLLLERNATVMMAHSKSPNLPELVAEADIVVAAVGVPDLVKGSWIKPGAIVIDVGINRLPSGKLCGDVEFSSAKDRAFAITPVPKGVGPMTVAMLMWNTLSCYESNK